jgi:hypothetical protein
MVAVICLSVFNLDAQQTDTVWHGIERTMHYQPQGNNFVCVNPTRKFNRALYGTNTAFRVEAGDLPEFALYMPGMGGNCKIGFIINNKSKWLTECDSINTVYVPGSMEYTLKDILLGNGQIKLAVLALADAEGMVVQLQSSNIIDSLKIVVLYGGASGKKFSRDGDIGADPESSFYLQPDYCKDNNFRIDKNSFKLLYGFSKNLSEEQRYEIQQGKPVEAERGSVKELVGLFPSSAVLQISDANQQSSPLSIVQASASSTVPVVTSMFSINNNEKTFFAVYKPETQKQLQSSLNNEFIKADQARKLIANRIKLNTPDPYINPLAGALSIAADAIWEEPSYMHGAVAWRMRLPAWRGAYCADPLGWHDRARQHFSSYAKSQATIPASLGVVADTALHLARQLEKMGTEMFSDGYICRNPNGDIRPHHYDMNLVFIDQLLNHFNWTGDMNYVKQMFPLIKKHLAWEKKNFDADGDGLYDAYAAIWASDALQYNGGGVAHSSAYNYRSNKSAAMLAFLIGEDGTQYEQEANKIFKAMNERLWLKDKGWFAEYKDLLGLQQVHGNAGLWTVYHTVDAALATPEQQYQMMRYVDNHIPHIPFKAKGLKDDGYYMLSTTNWQPYTWSVNNVVLAENLHTSLAYWQSNEKDNAFKLWKGSIIESMYASASPGGFEQLSFYDAIRGELYRDFADPIGIAARTLVEGLFGIKPDALQGKLLINPGFPKDWEYASIALPDIEVDFKMEGNESIYSFKQHFKTKLDLQLQVNAVKDKVQAVLVNGVQVKWSWKRDAIGCPAIIVNAGKLDSGTIEIIWVGSDIETVYFKKEIAQGSSVGYVFLGQAIVDIQVPQHVLDKLSFNKNSCSFIASAIGQHSFFIHLKQGEANWIMPVDINVKPAIEIIQEVKETGKLTVKVINNSPFNKKGKLFVNGKETHLVVLNKNQQYLAFISNEYIFAGSNAIKIAWNDGTFSSANITDWSLSSPPKKYQSLNIAASFNDKVSNIFKNKYLSPRPSSPTLQIPWQGIGNWCYPLTDAVINDSGLMNKKEINCNGIPFKLSSNEKNILFTSQWGNYPKQATVSLSGNATHAYLLMAGSTNHQQTDFTNGKIVVQYTDGSLDELKLINPTNWYPIEQDYFTDGFAFTTGASKPYRLLLKTGEFTRTFKKYSSIKGYSNYAIDGGAATILDMPLNKNKTLKNLTLKTLANEVVIGLMAITLIK